LALKTIGIAFLSISVLISFGLASNQAYAGVEAADENGVPVTPTTVGGIYEPVNESEVFGELAKQYSLWLIPAISAIAIGTYLVKRKF